MLFRSPKAPIILSGIVAEREGDIVRAAEENGYRVACAERENDWVALMIVRK